MTIALYGGTFDPITKGHMDIIDRSVKLFDSLIIAVAASASKNTLFSLEERVAMIEEIYVHEPKISVIGYARTLTVNLMQQNKANVMVRGLRGTSDFEYELQLANMNRSLWTDYESIFMTPRDNLSYISSTLIREIAQLGGSVQGLVDPLVDERLSKKV